MQQYDCVTLVLPTLAPCMDAGSKCGSVSQQLWLLLLQLQAIDSSPALASQAAAASERLAAACALSSSADLAAMHAPVLINNVTQVSADPQYSYACKDATSVLFVLKDGTYSPTRLVA